MSAIVFMTSGGIVVVLPCNVVLVAKFMWLWYTYLNCPLVVLLCSLLELPELLRFVCSPMSDANCDILLSNNLSIFSNNTGVNFSPSFIVRHIDVPANVYTNK